MKHPRDRKWSWRTTPTEESIGVHYTGDYKVEVRDQDGDNYFWDIYRREGNQVVHIAGGSLPCVGDFSYDDLMDINMEIAFFALRLLKDPVSAQRRGSGKG